MPEMPYQVFLRVGDDAPAGPPGFASVDITPRDLTVAGAIEAIRSSGITAADLRTKALFVASPALRDAAVLAYAAVCGFAGRRVDFTDLSSGVVDVRTLHEAASAAIDLGKPDPLPLLVQVGAAHPDSEVPAIPTLAHVNADEVTLIRYARQCRLALAGRPTGEALTMLVACAGLRSRLGGDRFPLLVAGDEVNFTGEEGEDYVAPGIDLDAVRREAAELRRSLRVDDRSVLSDPVPVTARQKSLAIAAATPPEEVMLRLGSYLNEETGLWRCPRPDRHKNGDANPSTRVSDGLVRCFRCDSEGVDTLRLVVDCTGLAPDDAAAWIASPGTIKAP